MLSNVFWILGIITYLLLLVTVAYNLVTQIKNERDFKKFKKKQNEMLNKMLNEREEN